MTRTDTATLKATTTIVSAVALFAAGDSFTHVYDLARQHNRGLHLHRPLGPREAMKGTGMYEQPKWAIPSAPTEQVPHGTMAPPAPKRRDPWRVVGFLIACLALPQPGPYVLHSGHPSDTAQIQQMQNTITGQQNMITMLNRVQAADARQIRILNGEVSTLGTQLSDYRNEFPNTCTQAILTNGQAGSFNVPCSPKQS